MGDFYIYIHDLKEFEQEKEYQKRLKTRNLTDQNLKTVDEFISIHGHVDNKSLNNVLQRVYVLHETNDPGICCGKFDNTLNLYKYDCQRSCSCCKYHPKLSVKIKSKRNKFYNDICFYKGK